MPGWRNPSRAFFVYYDALYSTILPQRARQIYTIAIARAYGIMLSDAR